MKSFGNSIGKFQFNFLVAGVQERLVSFNNKLVRKSCKTMPGAISCPPYVNYWEYFSFYFAKLLLSVFEKLQISLLLSWLDTNFQ